MVYPQHKHHRRSLRLRGFDYAQAGYFFVTIVVKDRECLLGEIVGNEMNLSDLGRMVAASWEWLENQYPYVGLDEYIVMPNHRHGIVVIEDSVNGVAALRRRVDCRIDPTSPRIQGIKRKPLGQLVGAFKTVSTREANIDRGTPGHRLWQRNYYEHVIRNEESLSQVRQYIRDNAAKWAVDRENPSLLTS